MARTPDERLHDLEERRKLSPVEQEFMAVIWSCPGGATTSQIHDAFPKLARGTKTATLAHISEKGYLRLEKRGNKYFYIATVSELEYERAVLRQKLSKAVGTNSVVNLVGMFCGRESLTKEEQAEITALLQKLTSKQKSGV